jgi:hypothetical protein
MAFGKKKDDALAAPAVTDSNPGGEIEPLVPADEGSDEREDAVEAEAAPEPVATPAPVEAAAAAPDATDSLLSMFQSGEDEETDRSVIVELAGDVDLPDLLEELHTLAAAMGIRV